MAFLRGVRRAGFALLCVAAVALVAGVLATTPRPAHADPAPATPVLVASPTPCVPRGGGCSTAPQQLAVTFPAGLPSGVDAVDLTWATAGRPSGAPGPAVGDVVLTTATGSCATAVGATATTCAWPWPAGLEVAGTGVVLNGTYRATPCTVATPAPSTTTPSTTTPSTTAAPTTTTSTSSTTTATSTDPSDTSGTGSTNARLADATTCPPAATPLATSFGVAVSPAPPGSVSVRAASSSANAPVTISWSVGTAPDLAGYVVTRNGTTIDTCTLHGASAAGAGPCGAAPSIVDRSAGSGHVVYEVAAVRYGLQGDLSSGVASVPAALSITLAGGTISALHAAPVIGVPVIPKTTVPAAPAAAGSATTATTADGFGQLPFTRSSEPGANAVSSPVLGRSVPSDPVDRDALIAAGLLILAIAGHLFTLRKAVGRYQAIHGSGSGPSASSGPE